MIYCGDFIIALGKDGKAYKKNLIMAGSYKKENQPVKTINNSSDELDKEVWTEIKLP